MSIYYFDALAGAGKTRALARYADRIARRGQKVLFVQPTKHLIDSTLNDEIRPFEPTYPHRAIHCGSPGVDAVIAEIVRHFEGAVPGQGEILSITHAALVRAPYLHKKRDRHLVVDEVPQVDVFEELRLPRAGHHIQPYLTAIVDGPVYVRLEAVKPVDGEVAA